MIVTYMPTMSFALDSSQTVKTDTEVEIVLKAAKKTNGSIKLSWNKVAGATKYKIVGNFSGKKSNKTIATLNGKNKSKVVKKVAGKKINLKKAKNEYRFEIRAYNKKNKLLAKSGTLSISKSNPEATSKDTSDKSDEEPAEEPTEKETDTDKAADTGNGSGNGSQAVADDSKDSTPPRFAKLLTGVPNDEVHYFFIVNDTTLFTWRFTKGSTNTNRSLPSESEVMAELENQGIKLAGRFAGWFEDVNCNTAFTLLPEKNESSMVIYGKWDDSHVEYAVQHYIENPDAEDVNNSYLYKLERTEIHAVQGGTTVTAQAQQYIGFTEKDQGTIKLDDKTTTYTIKKSGINDGELVLVMAYDADKYTINYFRNDGNDTKKSETVKHSQHVTMPDAATKFKDQYPGDPAGKKFSCWSTSKTSSDDLITAGSQITFTSNVDLYAQYNDYSYTLEYKENNGSGSENTITDTVFGDTAKKVQTAEEIGFSKGGYAFDYWTVDIATSGFSNPDAIPATLGDGGELPALAPAEKDAKVVLKANWRPYKYTIRYNYNLPSSQSGEQTQNKDHSATDNADLLTVDDDQNLYDFLGWSSTRDGAAEYNTVEEVTNALLRRDKQVIDLYAIWEPASYVLNFYDYNADSEWEDLGSRKIKVGDEYQIDVKPNNRKGYIFKGWATTDIENPFVYRTNGETVVNDTKTELSADAIIYNLIENDALTSQIVNHKCTFNLKAVWQPITYTVRFHPNIYSLGEDYLIAAPKSAEDSYLTSENARQVVTYEYQYDFPLYGEYDFLPHNLSEFGTAPTGYDQYKFGASIRGTWQWKDLDEYMDKEHDKTLSGWSFENMSRSYIPFVSSDSQEKTYNLTDQDGAELDLYGAWSVSDPCKYILECYSTAIPGEKEYEINGVIYNLIENVHVYFDENGEYIVKGKVVEIDPKTDINIKLLEDCGYTYNDQLTRSVAEFEDKEPLKGIVEDVNTDNDGLRIRVFFDRGTTPIKVNYYNINNDSAISSSEVAAASAPTSLDSIITGSIYSFPDAADIPGYKFQYWKFNGESKQYYYGDSISTHRHGSITLTACYEKTARVKFKYRTQDTQRVLFNDTQKQDKWPAEKFDCIEQLSGNYYRGDEYVLPEPGNDLSGYTFIGWLTEKDYYDFKNNVYGQTVVPYTDSETHFKRLYQPGDVRTVSMDSTDDVTYYAIYKENMITVGLETNVAPNGPDANNNAILVHTVYKAFSTEQNPVEYTDHNYNLAEAVGAWTTNSDIELAVVGEGNNGLRYIVKAEAIVTTPRNTGSDYSTKVFNGWYNELGELIERKNSISGKIKKSNLQTDEYGALVDQNIYASFEKIHVHKFLADDERVFATGIEGYNVEDHGKYRFFDASLHEIIDPNYIHYGGRNESFDPMLLLEAKYYTVERAASGPEFFVCKYVNNRTDKSEHFFDFPVYLSDQDVFYKYMKPRDGKERLIIEGLERLNEYYLNSVLQRTDDYTTARPLEIRTNDFNGKENTENIYNYFKGGSNISFDNEFYTKYDKTNPITYIKDNYNNGKSVCDPWYIPSKDEFQQLYNHFAAFGKESFSAIGCDRYVLTSTFGWGEGTCYSENDIGQKWVHKDIYLPCIFGRPADSIGWKLYFPGQAEQTGQDPSVAYSFFQTFTVANGKEVYNSGSVIPIRQWDEGNITDEKITTNYGGQYDEIKPLRKGEYTVTYHGLNGETKEVKVEGGTSTTIKSPSELGITIDKGIFANSWTTDSKGQYDKSSQWHTRTKTTRFKVGDIYKPSESFDLYPVVPDKKLEGGLFWVDSSAWILKKSEVSPAYEFYDKDGKLLEPKGGIDSCRNAYYYDCNGEENNITSTQDNGKGGEKALFMTYLTTDSNDPTSAPKYATGSFIDRPEYWYYDEYTKAHPYKWMFSDFNQALLDYTFFAKNYIVKQDSYQVLKNGIGDGLFNNKIILWPNYYCPEYGFPEFGPDEPADGYGWVEDLMRETGGNPAIFDHMGFDDHDDGAMGIAYGDNSPFTLAFKSSTNKVNGISNWYVPNEAEAKAFINYKGKNKDKFIITSYGKFFEPYEDYLTLEFYILDDDLDLNVKATNVNPAKDSRTYMNYTGQGSPYYMYYATPIICTHYQK